MAASRSKSQLGLPPMGLTTVPPDLERRGTSVPLDDLNQVRALLRRAVADCGYTLDALEAAMGKVRTYIHKVLQGEKPLSYEFIVALPNDVEARFEQLRAEHFGLIVAKPPTSREQAARDFISGVFGLSLLPADQKKAGAA
jgi:hypothetical protein